MSHELATTATGALAVAYLGTMPWHRGGTSMRPEDARDPCRWAPPAGLDYEVLSADPFADVTTGGVTTRVPAPSAKMLVRSDTLETLSIVGRDYKVVQPAEVLGFFRDIVADGGMEMETAGALLNGRRIWAQAKRARAYRLGGQGDGADLLHPRLLFVTSYDTHLASRVGGTTVRVVCNNTLSHAVMLGIAGVRIPHSSVFDERAVKVELGLLDDRMERFMTMADRFASRPLGEAEALAYFREVCARTIRRGKEEATRQAIALEVQTLGEELRHGKGSDLVTARNTLWGAVNAITARVDHASRARSAETRFASAQFGEGLRRKRIAVELAKARL